MGLLPYATYEARILALLNDAAQDRYTSAQIDAALRQALQVYSQNRPLIQTYSLDTDGNQTMELPSDFIATKIIKVELDASDIDDVRELTYYAFVKDEAWYIQTIGETIASGEVLTITYACNHTIDNLGSASGTTIPNEDEPFVCIGAAGYAQQQRASSRLESVNLNDDTIQRMMLLAQENINRFMKYIYPQVTSGYATLPALATDDF